MTELLQMIRDRLGLMRRLTLLRIRNRFSRLKVVGTGEVIVSLTTHGRRIEQVWQAIESVGSGTTRPKRLVLWLSNNERDKILPPSLLRLVKRGLEIEYVDDIGPHTKYFYALDECIKFNVPLITIDDDVLYLSWFLHRLLCAHVETPEQIICCRARQIELDEAGSLRPYNEWPYAETDQSSVRTFFTGVSGVIYPVAFLRSLKKRSRDFLQCCPRADDVWLNFVATETGWRVRQLQKKAIDFARARNTQSIALWQFNNNGGNDEQIAATYQGRALQILRVGDP